MPQSVWHKSAPQCVRILDQEFDGKDPRDVEAFHDAWRAWGNISASERAPCRWPSFCRAKPIRLPGRFPKNLFPAHHSPKR